MGATDISSSSRRSSFVASERLVWAEYPSTTPPPTQTTTTYWWPALVYENMTEFHALVAQTVHDTRNLRCKARMAIDLCHDLTMVHQGTQQQEPQRVLAFLGRPLEEYRSKIADESYRDFFLELSSMMAHQVHKPTLFASHQQQLYLDFHKGLDEAMAIVASASSSNSSEPPSRFLQQAQDLWNTTTITTTTTTGTNTNLHSHPPPHHHHNHHHEADGSPLGAHSVAAVSLAEDSTIAAQSTMTPNTATTPASNVATSVAAPPLQASPVSNQATWDQVWLKMQFSGWTFWNEDGTRWYHHPDVTTIDNSNHNANHQNRMTLEQVQAFAQEHYGWRPPPAPSRALGRRAPRAEHKYEFGVLWKRHLQPNGWTMQKPPRSKSELIDYYYVRPGRKNVVPNAHGGGGGVEGEDYFTTVDAVLEFCQKHSDYPVSSPETAFSPESTTGEQSILSPGDEESTLHEEDDESTLQPSSVHNDEEEEDASQFQTPREQRTVPQDPSKPLLSQASLMSSSDESSVDPYHWPNLKQRLQKFGWTWCKSKNPLQDFWYVRPNHQPNIEGEDYFTSITDVIQFCKEMDGVSMSSPTEQSPDLRQRQGRTTRGTRAAAKKQQPPPSEVALPRTTKSKDDKATKRQKEHQHQQKQQDQKRKELQRNLPHAFYVDPENNDAPWHIDPIGLVDYAFCQRVVGIEYKGGHYYLSGESHKDFTERFASTADVLKYYCLNPSKVPFDQDSSTPEDRDAFRRCARYVFVPGNQYDWSRTRRIDHQELVALLSELGVETFGSGTGTNKQGYRFGTQEFASLSELCNTLQAREYLEEGSARRRKSKLNEHQLMALRLRLAEPVNDDSELDDLLASENGTKDDTAKRNKRPLQPKNTNVIETKDVEDNEQSHPGSKSGHSSSSIHSKKRRKINNRPSHTRDETGKILVLYTGEGPNPAPWVTNPIPTQGWYELAAKFGCSYSSGKYFPPNAKSPSFGSIDGVLDYLGTHGGDYSLDDLPAVEQAIVERRLAYANVKAKLGDRNMLRYITVKEAKELLNLLGFEEEKGRGSAWKVPKALLPNLPQETYPSFEALCKALRPVEELEPSQQAGGRRRRKSASRDELILDVHQMSALRLFLAEDFASGTKRKSVVLDDDDSFNFCMDVERSKNEPMSSPVKEVITDGAMEVTSDVPNDSEDDAAGEEDFYLQVENSICTDSYGWKLLQKLGCKYSGGYRIPNGEKPYTNIKDLKQYILDNTIMCIDGMDSCSIEKEELKELHRWLKFTHVPLKKYKDLLGEAMEGFSGDNINRILLKLGIKQADGRYHLTSVGDTIGWELEDIVNLIRRSEDLADIVTSQQSGRYQPRKSSLSDSSTLDGLEEITLWLWAAESEYSLPHFDEDHLCPGDLEDDTQKQEVEEVPLTQTQAEDESMQSMSVHKEDSPSPDEGVEQQNLSQGTDAMELCPEPVSNLEGIPIAAEKEEETQGTEEVSIDMESKEETASLRSTKATVESLGYVESLGDMLSVNEKTAKSPVIEAEESKNQQDQPVVDEKKSASSEVNGVGAGLFSTGEVVVEPHNLDQDDEGSLETHTSSVKNAGHAELEAMKTDSEKQSPWASNFSTQPSESEKAIGENDTFVNYMNETGAPQCTLMDDESEEDGEIPETEHDGNLFLTQDFANPALYFPE